MRSNDYRIVRFQLSNEARGKQIQFAKTESGIHLVLKMLKNQKTESRKLGAELIHLLATENYPLSQRIGLNAWLPDSAGIRVSSTFRSKPKVQILFILIVEFIQLVINSVYLFVFPDAGDFIVFEHFRR